MLPHFWSTLVNLWISTWAKCQLTGHFPALIKVGLASDLRQFRPVYLTNPFAVLTPTLVLPHR